MKDPQILDKITKDTQRLVRTPSQARLNQYGPVLREVAAMAADNGLNWTPLKNEDFDDVGLYLKIEGAQPGPAYCLNACVDTAPVGEEEAQWAHPPFEGRIVDMGGAKRLYGRGAADSKVAVAIFTQIARDLNTSFTRKNMKGTLYVMFDADEHSGNFGGAKAFLREMEQQGTNLDGMMIGYADDEAINVGARGFTRCTIVVPGKQAHSGMRSDPALNPNWRVADIVTRLKALGAKLPRHDDDFNKQPGLTVTGIYSGDGRGQFSTIPGKGFIDVDVRTTPVFNDAAARQEIEKLVREVDKQFGLGESHQCQLVFQEAWPEYRLSIDNPMVRALAEGAARALSRPVDTKICRPSNIANYLASMGVPATCGFGAKCGGIHQRDEYIELDSVIPTYQAYRGTVRQLMGLKP